MYIICANIKKKLMETIKKFNRKAGVVLAILSILSGIAIYIGIDAILYASIAVSAIIAIIALLQVFNTELWLQEMNPTSQWLIIAAIAGIICIATLFATGTQAIPIKLGQAIFLGATPLMIPLLGAFLGNTGRILWNKPSLDI